MKEEKSVHKSSTERKGSTEAREDASDSRARRPVPRNPTSGSDVQAVQGETQRMLNALLADEFVLYVRTLNYHWNVRGMQFHSLHLFFERLYEEQAKFIDDIAEKVRSSGAYAVATLEEYLELSTLREERGDPPDPRTMIETLVSDHEAIIKELHNGIKLVRDKYEDPSTENFLAELLDRHEKTTWMLNIHLDRELS